MSAERKVFGKLQGMAETPPDLIAIQTKSYREFLQADVAPQKRENVGLQAMFKEIFPVSSYDGRYKVDFVSYQLDPPKKSYLQALMDGETYARPLRATFRLLEGEDVREEQVFLGDMPVMTPDGAFVINGAERVIVSQLHRSPGISTERQVHANGQPLLSVRIIPDRGNWIEVMFDTNDVMWCFMDQRRRRRKFYATTLLRAFGYGLDEQLMQLFYDFKKLPTGTKYADKDLRLLVMKDDLVDADSQAVIARRYDPVTPAMMEQVAAAGISEVEVVDVAVDNGTLIKTLREDAKAGIHNEEDALKEIYRRMRPGDPPTASNAKQMIHRMFFELSHYDLGYVGRHKINKKLGLTGKVDENLRTLHESGIDVIEAIRLLLKIYVGKEQVDDIDHLGNRRIRTTGELLENQCRVGLARTERLIRERMTSYNPEQGPLTPQRLVNSKTFSAVVNDFFARSQLSQFMDQTNPLSALAHKRRLSALGPGGLSRERAGFEVRDVHPSHYGRICPIETPEGPNIGLISSLGIYAQVNRFGFIETPYRKVIAGKVTDEIEYLPADNEEQFVIAQANAPLNADRTFAEDRVTCRYRTEFCEKPAREVQYMDVAPMQVISIAAGLIPFLEHDDANRALMGANMMRQGVPLMTTERPYVGTGLEGVSAKDSRVIVTAQEDGVVAYVSAEIILTTKDGSLPEGVEPNPANPGEYDFAKEVEKGVVRYRLQKFRRCNAGTCFNQKPIVKRGQAVKAGDCLADGPATDQGELALGKNLLVAFMSWRGYNFEDAILVNERLVREDALTSLHIITFECGARDTKLGPEEITRDIPNVGEDALKNLGPDGIIRVGAEVKPGDILVGKVTPKGETELSPEERLLRAIFGEKAADVRDTSLTVPPGTTGVVMGVQVSTAQNTEAPDEKRTKRALKDAEKKRKNQLVKIEKDLIARLASEIMNEKLPVDITDAETGDVIVPANKKIKKSQLAMLAKAHAHWQMEEGPAKARVSGIMEPFEEEFAAIEDAAENPDGGLFGEFGGDGEVVKQVRVFLVDKKNLSVGDKMAGRHGNKGVVSRILPSCDMPFLPDGRPVDIVLNPLGVPSRMNLGQLFETYLGLACRLLNFHAATPVFDGVQETEIDELLKQARAVQEQEEGPQAWICPEGKTVLYDGLTGDPFEQRVVVGVIYMLKLHHLVTDKIHARAVGPYSLVTQQPLGGKAQLGGQRMGEMEVWALEAYGVAYALQELLTVKSDDVQGRTRIYESIVKGTNILDSGMPESFSVLIHELRGLCLDTQLLGGEIDSRRKGEGTQATTTPPPAAAAADDLLAGALNL